MYKQCSPEMLLLNSFHVVNDCLTISLLSGGNPVISILSAPLFC